MCRSEADSMVIRTLPLLSSALSRRARLFAKIVPPMPPPMISILILRLLLPTRCLLGLAYDDVPDAVLLPRFEEVVLDLVDPLGDIGCRALVGRQHFQLVADLNHLHRRDQLHERAGTETSPRIHDSSVGHHAV